MLASPQKKAKPDSRFTGSSETKSHIGMSTIPQGFPKTMQRNLGNSAFENFADGITGSISPAHDGRFSIIQRKCACGSGCLENEPYEKTSLRVSQPGDFQERQADMTAEQILAKLGSTNTPQTQMPLPIMDEIGVDLGDITDENPTTGFASKAKTTHKETGGSATEARPSLRSLPQGEGAFSSRLGAQYGQGQSLPASFREIVEPHIGYDLSAVRVYPREADAFAADVGARAFTLGRNIYFRDGEYRPTDRDGMRVLLHELVHTTQDGEEEIQRMPSISSWNFSNSGALSSDNCCTARPAGLGVGVANYKNGMELQASISNHEEGASYDIKRVKERSTWKRVGGVWINLSHVGPGADDDSHNADECLTPSYSPPHIYSTDEPGFNGAASFDAAATDMVYKASFTEFVEITDSYGNTSTDGNGQDWHTISWVSQSGGAWALDAAKSEVATGSVTVGTAAP